MRPHGSVKALVLAAYKEHPDWTAKQLGEATQTLPRNVGRILSDAGLKAPLGGNGGRPGINGDGHAAAIAVRFSSEEMETLRWLANDENKSLSALIRDLATRGLTA